MGECSDLEPRWLIAMSRLLKRSIRVMRSRRGRPLFAVGSNDMNGSIGSKAPAGRANLNGSNQSEADFQSYIPTLGR